MRPTPLAGHSERVPVLRALGLVSWTLLAGPLLASCTPRVPSVPPKQAKEVPDSAFQRCLDQVPERLLARRVYYLQATLGDTGARAFLPQADVLAQRVATQARRLLGATSDSLPVGEPVLRWRDADNAVLLVTIHRDGRTTSREPPREGGIDTTGVAFLRSALATAIAGQRVVEWPTELGRDSVRLRLEFSRTDSADYPKAMGPGFPVAWIKAPVEETPRVVEHPPIHYPREVLTSGVIGTVMMQVVVDTSGRAEPSSIEDIWPEGRPRLQGRPASYYGQLVRAARETLLGARFTPGRIGGCVMRTRVKVPFNFFIGQMRLPGP